MMAGGYSQGVPLPQGWREVKNEQGRPYYYHITTRKPQWAHPGLQQMRMQQQQQGSAGTQQQQQQHQQPKDPSAIDDKELEPLMDKLSEEVFHTYSATTINRGKPHPGHVVEASSLASVSLPPAEFPLFDSLPSSIVDDGVLSELQLEGVLYACQRHQKILHTGHRAGFFLGDGAGVGKGRQIAGVILDSYIRGRKKHVWFSTSTDLKNDAERDLRDLGCFINVIDGCQDIDKGTLALGLTKEKQTGVLFSTYMSLVSDGRRGQKSRREQILKWCGESEFDGCLVFDESHKAKSYYEGTDSHKTSKVASSVVELQRRMPKARVLYCSATGVSELKNMAFMERLGLWGDCTNFTTFASFSSTISDNGLGAMEQLAMEMKASGIYLARGLSFDNAEFYPMEIILRKKEVEVYNSAVKLWFHIRDAFKHAIEKRNAHVKPRLWGTFWGAHQRFFKQLCMALKVPDLVADAKEELAKGNSVVVGLQTTGEASLVFSQQDEIGDTHGKSLPEIPSTCKEILRGLVITQFPTRVPVKKTADSVQVDDDTNPKDDPMLLAAKLDLINTITKANLPCNALDSLIDAFGGPEQVAEMTGRSHRVVKGSNGQFVLEARKDFNIDAINITEAKNFMNGNKIVAIISDAASTGISLHADRRVKNQRRRIHYTIELPWSAEKAIQQLGRTHRSNASSCPIYKLVTTNVGGEQRFAAAVAHRLQSLGALTKGDRRAATGQDFSAYNLNNSYGKKAVKTLVTSFNAGYSPSMVDRTSAQNIVKRARVMVPPCDGVDDSELDTCVNESFFLSVCYSSLEDVDGVDPALTVSGFLRRLLGLPLHRQALLFAYFSEVFALLISDAKAEGRYNEGVVDITGENIEVVSGPTQITPTLQHLHFSVDRGVCFQRALIKWKEAPQGHAAFYVSKRKQYGRHLALLAIKKESAKYLYISTRPNTGESKVELDETDLMKYKKVPNEVVEELAKCLEENAKSDVELLEENGNSQEKDENLQEKDESSQGKEDKLVEVVNSEGNNLEEKEKIDQELKGESDSNSKEKDQMDTDTTDTEDTEEEKADSEGESESVKARKSGKEELKLKEIWEDIYEGCLNHCVHKNGCKAGAKCAVGIRVSPLHVLCGQIIACWTQLQQALKNLPDLKTSERTMKIVRVALSNGQRVVGLSSPASLVAIAPSAVNLLGAPPKKPQTNIRGETWIQSVANAFKTEKFAQALSAGYNHGDAQNYAESQVKAYLSDVRAKEAARKYREEAAYQVAVKEYQEKTLQLEKALQPLNQEPAAPVSAVCLKKATTKPLNMHSFFKPVEKRKSDDIVEKKHIQALGARPKKSRKKSNNLAGMTSIQKAFSRNLSSQSTSSQPPRTAESPQTTTTTTTHECPSCGKAIEASAMNAHLDTCLV
eukprot:m.65130 g.65130  ORF g.65130 m.65130 type:complete len:1396 (-) comp11709_c0_seq1:101-4288(-)